MFKNRSTEENKPSHPPLAFCGIDIPPPTLDDKNWEKEFQNHLKNDRIYELRDMLHKALNKKNLTRLSIGLRLQHEHPDKDFLKEGDPSLLYSDIWEAKPVSILEMYINAYHPTKLLYRGKDLRQQTLNDLSYDTREDWYRNGCGAFTAPLMLSFIATGHFGMAITLLHDPQFDVNYKSAEPLRNMIKQGHWGVFQIMLNKDPDLRSCGKDIVRSALQQEDTRFLNALIAQKDIISYLDNNEINELMKTAAKEDHFKILKEAQKAHIKEHGLKQPCRVTKDWTVLSERFVEYSRPKSPDGSQSKYQVDFDAGYVSYHYRNKDNEFIPFETKLLAEVYAQNPQLINKAIKALTDIGCPAPDLSSLFNQTHQTTRTIKTVPALSKQPKPANMPTGTHR